MRGRWYLILAVCLLCTACFKDEPLNEECDIETAWLQLDNPEQMFYKESDMQITVPYQSNRIVFTVREGADVSALALYFTITPGASIEPASGSVHDFSRPVTYTVTSEDGEWQRVYTVSFRSQTKTVSDTVKMDFEHYRLSQDGYAVWYELSEDGEERPVWASGNAGFNMTGGASNPQEYPTAVLENGYDGAGLRLTTRSTGSLGAMVGKRLAAGNLFLGEFDLSQTLTASLKTTRFGIPFARKPVKVTGFYQYAPGATYTGPNGRPVPGRTDQGDIYAVFYRNTDASGGSVTLYGDDVLTSLHVVAVARMTDMAPAGHWTAFEMTFSYLDDVDPELLKENGYNFTIVFSSSLNGAMFEGAVGSTLLIDRVRIICETEE